MKTKATFSNRPLKLFTLFAAIGLAIQMANGQSVTTPSGLIGWWPGDGNANDISGNDNNGVLMNGTSFAPGVVGQAFNFDGVSNYVEVATTDSLNPMAGQGWTVEGWINPATNNYMVIVHKGSELGTTDPYDYGRQFWALTFRGDMPGTPIEFNIGQTGYNTDQMDSAAGIEPGQWVHVAVSITSMGGPGSAYSFYINGTNAGTQVLFDGTVGSITTTEPLRIGAGIGYSDELTGFFQGQIDEISIYNRALSASEIAAIYSAGSAGKSKPQVSIQPPGQVGYWGQSVTFSAAVANFSPLSYQWFFNATPISGATDASLILTNLQSTNAGNYSVSSYYSPDNSITSAPASLTVQTAGVNIALYSGVTIDGVVGYTYGNLCKSI